MQDLIRGTDATPGGGNYDRKSMRIQLIRKGAFTLVTRGHFLDVGVKSASNSRIFDISAKNNDRSSPTVKTPWG